MKSMSSIDPDVVKRQALIVESNATLLVLHLREIANNELYHGHKGKIRARIREIKKLQTLLVIVEKDLVQVAYEEESGSVTTI